MSMNIEGGGAPKRRTKRVSKSIVEAAGGIADDERLLSAEPDLVLGSLAELVALTSASARSL